MFYTECIKKANQSIEILKMGLKNHINIDPLVFSDVITDGIIFCLKINSIWKSVEKRIFKIEGSYKKNA